MGESDPQRALFCLLSPSRASCRDTPISSAGLFPLRLACVLVLALLLLPASVAVAQGPRETTNARDDMVQRLQATYLDYRKAALRGDVEAVLPYLTREVAQKSAGMPPPLLKAMSESELDPHQAEFVRLDATGSAARLVYRKIGSEQRQWQAVLFEREDGAWKIERIAQVARSGPEVADGLDQLLQETAAELGP